MANHCPPISELIMEVHHLLLKAKTPFLLWLAGFELTSISKCRTKYLKRHSLGLRPLTP